MSRHQSTRLPRETIQEIWRLAHAYWDIGLIAEELGVSKRLVYLVLVGDIQ